MAYSHHAWKQHDTIYMHFRLALETYCVKMELFQIQFPLNQGDFFKINFWSNWKALKISRVIWRSANQCKKVQEVTLA